jgi:hypothetical protein
VINANFITGLVYPVSLAVAEAVSQQTQLTQNIRSLQTVIAALPPSAFKSAGLKNAMLIEFDAVLLTITVHDYSAALPLLQNVILPETNGCATTGRPKGVTGLLTVQTRAWSIRPFSTLSRRLRP